MMKCCALFILIIALLLSALSIAGTRWNARGAIFAKVPPICKTGNSGKVGVVTGACSGLGRDMADGLIDAGFATVYYLCRNIDYVKGKDKAVGVQIDLTSFKSVYDAVKELPEAVDVLVLNAGIWDNKEEVEGLSKSAMVNHYSQFALTQALLPNLKRVNGRVVIVSSAMNSMGGIDFRDDPTLLSEMYDSEGGSTRYGTTKLMNILTAKKLAREGIVSYSVHPGIIKTDLHREENDSSSGLTKVIRMFALWNLIGISTEEGAAATLYLSTCNTGNPGGYYHGTLEVEANPLAESLSLQDFLYTHSLSIISAHQV